MRDAALVRQASLKASGADIHEVTNLIAAYDEACRLMANPKAFQDLLPGGDEARERLVKWAAKWREEYEGALQAYICGTPIRKAVGTLRGPWWYRMKIGEILRSAGARVRSVSGLRPHVSVSG